MTTLLTSAHYDGDERPSVVALVPVEAEITALRDDAERRYQRLREEIEALQIASEMLEVTRGEVPGAIISLLPERDALRTEHDAATALVA